ncbi:MAG: endonuclease domain-containing protein [bacterium]
MDKIFNNKNLKSLLIKLRREMTQPEVILWNRLRDKQIAGCKFRRQHSIGRYIADFYCVEHKLVIEVDGETHYISESAKVDDTIRDNYFHALEIAVLHFTNKDIIENCDGVITVIYNFLTKPEMQPPPTPPCKGGEKKQH